MVLISSCNVSFFARTPISISNSTCITDWSAMTTSATQVVHADSGYDKPRRVPQLLARGPFNTWGFDKGISAKMDHREDGKWELEIMASWPSYVQLNVFGYDDYFYGDTDGDGVMERLPPNSAGMSFFHLFSIHLSSSS